MLKAGAAVGAAGGAGLLGYEVIPQSPSAQLPRVDVLAREFQASLDAEQRADTCVAYDHPLRQYHNRGVWGGGREVLFGFSRHQRRILTDLLYAGLSEEGRQRIPDEYFAKFSGVHGMRVLVCGDPAAPPYQIVLTGAHLNLRLGGRSREGAAFGGPQVYGDQRGNDRVGLPGNVYRDQFTLAQQLLHRLAPADRRLAILEDAPVQTAVELQGRNGRFPGVAIGTLADDQQRLARELVDRILATYAPEDSAYARTCLDANGGIAGLSLSYYQRGQDGDIPDAQVFRLEGSGAVMHFRGYPHVHAFINIAMDGDAPLSSGEVLGENPAWLERDGVATLFERALRRETRADAGYYPKDSVAGRLRRGTIRSGDIYTLESWQDDVQVGQIHGSLLASARRLPTDLQSVDPGRMYSIASTPYGIDRLREQVGRVESVQSRGLLRDLVIADVKKNGFVAVQGDGGGPS
jgi:hypothetical protein